jgi:hypothetical protein
MSGITKVIIVLIVAMAAFLIGAFSFGYLFNKKKCCLSPDNFQKCFGDKASNFSKLCCQDNNNWVDMNGLSDKDPHTNGFMKYCGNQNNQNNQNNCLDGPAYWCGSVDNWMKCKKTSESDPHTNGYNSMCCKDNKTWMDNSGTKDPDPNTNGFNKNCT